MTELIDKLKEAVYDSITGNAQILDEDLLHENLKKVLSSPTNVECNHSYTMVGHQMNGHLECTSCNHIKSLS